MVTRHKAVLINSERILYIQIGLLGKTGNTPVHITGYNSFNVFIRPYKYHGGIGKAWLEPGDTNVIIIICGDNDFGLG